MCKFREKLVHNYCQQMINGHMGPGLKTPPRLTNVGMFADTLATITVNIFTRW